jgi:hypothetical protein
VTFRRGNVCSRATVAATERTDVWSWPEDSSHWLAGAPREDTIKGVLAGFRQFGYERCDTGEPEAGVEKVCVYAIEDDPHHVARHLPSGE